MHPHRRADIAVSVALFLLIATFTLAAVEVADETEARVRCASNLSQIGQGMILYSNDNRGAYPRTIANINDPKPTWGTPYEGNPNVGPMKPGEADPFDEKNSKVVPKPNDVTAALYLIMRTQDITSAVYVCPSSGSEHWGFGGVPPEDKKREYGEGAYMALNWTNWPGNKALADHLSYSYQNPYPTKEAIGAGFKFNNTLSAEFAVAADMNPGTDALTKLVLDSTATEMRKGNSINHDGQGQNILFGDGHVSFEVTPFVGVQRDNIYTFGDSGDAAKDKGGDGIVGSPVGPNDSILLPTSKDLGTIDAAGNLTEQTRKRREGAIAKMDPPAPDQLPALRGKLQGTYRHAMQNQRVILTVTDTTLTATSGPVTIKFDYTIDGAAKESLKLGLTAPDTKATAVVKFTNDGLQIRGTPWIEGQWKRQ